MTSRALLLRGPSGPFVRPSPQTIRVGRPFVRPETPVTSFCGPITAGWWVRTPCPAKRLVRPPPRRGSYVLPGQGVRSYVLPSSRSADYVRLPSSSSDRSRGEKTFLAWLSVLSHRVVALWFFATTSAWFFRRVVAWLRGCGRGGVFLTKIPYIQGERLTTTLCSTPFPPPILHCSPKTLPLC